MTTDTGPQGRSRLARAKVNYALHVTGRRADGYHLLQSLVAFPELGDRLELAGAGTGGLAVDGPFAADLGHDAGGADNLVLRAARALAGGLGREPGTLAFRLEKNLPVASGIGGGSADAAAALHLAFEALAGRPAGTADHGLLSRVALSLGADVPMCLTSRPSLVGGIGDQLSPLETFPEHAIVLVNPRVPLSTPRVFAALARRDNPPLPPFGYNGLAGFEELVGWLGDTRNDLEPAAMAVAPEIGDVLTALRRRDGVRLARMSGSGATCFALVGTLRDARDVAAGIAADRPGWWVAAASVAGTGPDAA
jgi:4-diphosphocytidyl-2-C-methyl-D-erythritol kinase